MLGIKKKGMEKRSEGPVLGMRERHRDRKSLTEKGKKRDSGDPTLKYLQQPSWGDGGFFNVHINIAEATKPNKGLRQRI
jgi:hypothetical protein